MIGVAPQLQIGKYRVPRVNLPVIVSAVCRFILNGESAQTVCRFAFRQQRLRRAAAEQFSAVIYPAVFVSIERQPRVVRSGGSPRDLSRRAVVHNIERNARLRVGQIKAVARHINDNRRDAGQVFGSHVPPFKVQLDSSIVLQQPGD